jgi:hypothetical protein
LVSEHLNGRTYRAREQVVLFLKGLDTEFAPAIQYIETLMDSWGKEGLNPKCEIRYLPRTIEAFMKTHATESTPVMRATKLQDITTDEFMEMIRATNTREGLKKGKQVTQEGPRNPLTSTAMPMAPMDMTGVIVIFWLNYSRQWNSWQI